MAAVFGTSAAIVFGAMLIFIGWILFMTAYKPVATK
jgi:hypothetical protein